MNSTGRSCPICGAILEGEFKKCRMCGEWICCPSCDTWRSDGGRVCRQCGQSYPVRNMGSVPTAAAPSEPAYRPVVPQQLPTSVPPTANQPTAINVYNQTPQPPESKTFAIVTCVLWFFLPPVAFILNIIGLITGPRRGCFVSMLLFFVGLAVILVLTLLALGIALPISFANFLKDIMK
jgi:hypothetical protein